MLTTFDPNLVSDQLAGRRRVDRQSAGKQSAGKQSAGKQSELNRRPSERGSAVIPSLVAMGMILVMLTLFTQFAVWQYGRGVLRSAALEAARSEAVLDAGAGACEARFEQVRSDLLGGQMSDGVGAVHCELLEDRVIVTVDAHFDKWLPISPDWDFTVTAVATREVEPE